MLGGHLRFAPVATVRTPALMQDPVGHLHRDQWQLQHVMRVVRPRQGKCRVATWTPLGSQLLDRCGKQKRLMMPQMAWFPTRFAVWGRGRPLPWLLVGRVR